MKTNNKIKMFAVVAMALSAVACTDTWDEHYGNEGRPARKGASLFRYGPGWFVAHGVAYRLYALAYRPLDWLGG